MTKMKKNHHVNPMKGYNGMVSIKKTTPFSIFYNIIIQGYTLKDLILYLSVSFFIPLAEKAECYMTRVEG